MWTLVRACQCYWNVAQTCEMCMHPPPRGVCTLAGRPSGGVVIGDAVAKGECVSSRVLVWCLLAPSRGGVLLLGETWSAVLTLGDPCLFYGPFPANAHPP